MGNPFFLAPVTEPVDARGGHSRDEQAHAHNSDPGKNLEPHRDAVPEAKHSLPGPLKVTRLRSLPGKLPEKTLEILLDSKEIKPVHPKGNQSRIFIGRTDAEAETPILWSPDAKN